MIGGALLCQALSVLRAFLAHLFVAVALVEQGPFVRALDHAAFDRIDLAPHDRVDLVALLVELRDDFAGLPQRQWKVRNLGQSLVAQFCQRFARQEQHSCFGEFHFYSVKFFFSARRCRIKVRSRVTSRRVSRRASASAILSASSSICASVSKFADISSTTHATSSLTSLFGLITPRSINPLTR